MRVLALVAVVLLVLSSAASFRYARKLHLCRMHIVECVPSLDVVRAHELWAGEAGVWQINRRAYIFGLVLFWSGLTAQLLVVVHVFLFPDLG